MRENLYPLVEVIQGKLVFAHFSFMSNRTVTSELTILGFLQKPTRFAVLEIGGQVRDSCRILSEFQASSNQLLEGDLREGAVGSPEHMDLDHLADLNLRALTHHLEPARIQFQVLGGFWLLQVLPQVLVSDGQLLQGVLGPASVVVHLKQDGSPLLGQQLIWALGVLADLKIR